MGKKSIAAGLLSAVFMMSEAAAISPSEFSQCLVEFEQKAVSGGVDRSLARKVVPELKLQKKVLDLDGKQPEFVQTFGSYLAKRVTAKRVEQGRRLYQEHRVLLDQLTREYGVPGQYLVAFWGLETNFGGYMGNMPTLDSLATLACDPRRSDFFTGELIAALKLMGRESFSRENMKGSWAGAVGQTQFMPSNYLRFGVDGDGDGAVNLWRSTDDALASGANLLRHIGWNPGLRWGREVKLPDNFDFGAALSVRQRSLREWRELGIRRGDGGPLPVADISAKLLVPAGHQGPAFLVYDNFSIIMGWNRSESYALSVGLLADRIAGGGGLYRSPPKQQAMSIADMKALQASLNSSGYDAGEPDGIFGPATRSALLAYQKDAGLVADGFPDAKTVSKLLN